MARERPTYSYLEEWKSLWEPDLEAIAFNGATCDPTRVDPKVLQWVKKHCAQNPHFIKVIIPGAVTDRPGLTPRSKSYCKLVVPSPFVEQHFRKLERVVKLENEAGKTWKVSFGAPTRHPSWQQGWCRVASDNNLKPGDVVVFVLVGNSHFRFTHFDEDGNRISHNPKTAIKQEKPGSSSSSQSRDSKRAPPPLLSKKEDQSTAESDELRERAQVTPGGLGFDRHGHEVSQLFAPTEKQMSDSCKRRRLCKVGEKLKACRNLAMNNIDDARDFEEAGSTSMAENPNSNSTIVSVRSPHGEEGNLRGGDVGNSRHSSSTDNNSAPN